MTDTSNNVLDQLEAARSGYQRWLDAMKEAKEDIKILDAADKYGFRVPYDGTNNFYDKEAIKHFIAGAKWMRDQLSTINKA